MLKRIIIIGWCLGLMFSGMAQDTSWVGAIVRLKGEIRRGKIQSVAPVFSRVMRHQIKPQILFMNVEGVQNLLLTTWGTTDGNDWDHAVWGNARLITLDGKSVWLDELKWQSVKAPYDTPLINRHFSGNKLQIGGKIYDHGVLVHADGEVIYALDKKYKTFEAEVGIDDRANAASSVVFSAKDAASTSSVEKIAEPMRGKILRYAMAQGVSAEQWLSVSDASLEKEMVLNIIDEFADRTWFDKQINQIEQWEIDKQIVEYLRLVDVAHTVATIVAELKWLNIEALRLAYDDMCKIPGFDKEKYGKKLHRIEAILPIVSEKVYSGDPEIIAQARCMINDRKELLLANPLLDGDRIIATRFKLNENARSAMAPALGMPENNWSGMYSAKRHNRNAEIVELSDLRGRVKAKTIYKPERNVGIADLQIHWDGDKLLFSSVDTQDRWQVYEIDVDGKDFHQKVKVDEPDLEFCDANYLPDGRIVMASNVGYQGVPCVCGDDKVGNLSLYDPRNGHFRRLTFDQDGNWNPIVMNNGRVMYTRWEYTDLTHYFSRIVMHMNPDGTENKALYGSGSFWPNSTFDIKPLPGNTTRFVGIISGHHGIARSGRLMIFDPAKSRKEEKGVIQELPFHNRKIIPEVKDGLVDGVWPQFIRPYPLNASYFLVTAKLDPKGLWGIYLVDIFDNLTCIAEFEGEGLNMPVIPNKRPIPPIIPDRVNLADKEATVFIQDIYAGEGTEGVPRGVIKKIRVFAYEYAYWSSPSDHDAQGIQSGWDIKRLLGTVPVENDGSVIFKVPANTPISLQPLDKEGCAVQWMRSWFTPMPGEIVSCIGCHEDQNLIPIPKRTMASQIKPHALQTPEGGTRSFTFDLEVQPLLDRACVACHNDKHKINLTGGRIDHNYTRFGRKWSKSYLAIMPYIYRQGAEAEMYVLKPYEYHASNSELIRILKEGHHQVKLTDREWRILYNWIDFNAPYHGCFHNISKANSFDQYDRRRELADKYNNGAGVDWRKEIADYADYLKKKGKIVSEMPKKEKSVKYKQTKLKNWPFNAQKAKAMQDDIKNKNRYIEIAPGIVINFVWIPAGKFIMGDQQNIHAPTLRNEVKEGFWMAETETSNEQYTALVPLHNSRIIGQFWKDHTTAGYPANKPKQPVIRVSYEEAIHYCNKLAEKTGLPIALPTEAEWEWACRAGSDKSFWYGELSDNFGQFDNMADAQLSGMAVQGVDPQPMSANEPLRRYWDYIPKIDSVDDRNMLMAFVGSYRPNPWGLKDMHGNVAEWTYSEEAADPPYGKKEAEKKIARGGSWIDRPKYCTSYIRKAFYPWQKVYNVGFRVILRDK